MFTLDTNEGKAYAIKKVKAFIIITILVAIFEIIYESFSHGVISVYMVVAFAFPLLMGVIFWLVLAKINRKIIVSSLFINCWDATLFTLMLGFIYKGILEIYGTNSNLTVAFWVAAAAMFMAALVAFGSRQISK